MGRQYVCKHERRRQAVRDHPALNGIDYLEVLDQQAPAGSPRQQTLLVRCFKTVPADLGGDNCRLEGGVRITSIPVQWAGRAADAADLFARGLISQTEHDFLLGQRDPDHLLVVRTEQYGDFSTYRLRLVLSPTRPQPPSGFDPVLAQVDFSFKVECPSDFDCQPTSTCPPEPPGPEPPINYLAKDYASFRQLMLDRLAVIMPDWQERNPADLGIVLVELLAYAADHLSYYQDAVATEAYLGTARKRTSVRRHARLLDYPMHEGCNARSWVQVQVESDNVRLPAGTPLLSRLAGLDPRIQPDASDYQRAMARRPVVWETMHDVTLFAAHNEIAFYTWGEEACCLPRGATRATLLGSLPNLQPGDVLVLEEIVGAGTQKLAEAEPADPAHRHAVRLTQVVPSTDPLGGQFADPPSDAPVPVTEVAWAAEDALPFPLCLSTLMEGETPLEVSVARGNIVLADHGRTVAGEPLPPVPAEGRYRPRLPLPGITHCVPYPHERARSRPAAQALPQDPRAALPAIELHENSGAQWTPRRDLLHSDRFARNFVVEMEEDGRACLRFGDGLHGERPAGGVVLEPLYRIGNGHAGNIGAEAIAHVVTIEDGITGVRNPMPAQGGTLRERVDEVRLYAPQAFRTQERAVTEADYAEVAQRHPGVQKAVATRRWTGSWHTMFITVDRKGGRPVDADFENELGTFLERYRLAGHDIEIDAPRFVPLDIALAVCVAPGYFRSDVQEALLETFGSKDLPNRRRAFFHPDNFTFGQSVYLSQIIATAMEVPGVLWVDVKGKQDKPSRFHRWGQRAGHEIEEGLIRMGRLEIARLDNDPNAPENGKIEFYMEGGL